MRVIYSTEKIRVSGVEVRGIDKLSPFMRRWVIANRKRLQQSATLPERISSQMLSKFDDKPVRQAFFMIRGRAYFLDFFFPERMIAVEIDGSVHKLKRERDRRRDADFRSIGIKTVRIKNQDVMKGKLYEKLFKKIYRQL